MLDTAGFGDAGSRSRVLAAAPPIDEASRVRLARVVALGTAAFALALGTPLVVMAATGDQLRYPVAAASLRAAWIGLYALVGLYAARSRAHLRLGVVMTCLAALAALASTDALQGSVAYTTSRTVSLANVPLLVLMLVSVTEARAVRVRVQALLLISVPVVLALGTAYMMVAAQAPWGQSGSQCNGACAGSAIQVTDNDGLARALIVAVAVALIVPLVATVVVMFREIRRPSPITGHALRVLGWLATVWSAPLVVGYAVVVFRPAPEGLSPYLWGSGVVRAALPIAMLVVLFQRAARTGAMRDQLTWRLARADDPAHVERALSDVLGDPTLRLAFRNADEWIDVDGRPVPAASAGRERGWVTMDGDGSAALIFDPALEAQQERMQAVAGLGAAALERARTEAELRATRRRLIDVAEQERQRIERNLHDGAQQRLISMALRVAMAREEVAAHPDVALGLLRGFATDLQQALDELRELSHGLHPPVLVDHGIAEALRAAARHAPVPVDVAIARIGRLAPEDEAAIYFCCAEALQNALKHAGPGARISIGLREDEGVLAFEVADDGPGFAVIPMRPGGGLMGMKDRIAAVGGTLTIDSTPGRGTWIHGRVPFRPVLAAALPPTA